MIVLDRYRTMMLSDQLLDRITVWMSRRILERSCCLTIRATDKQSTTDED